MGIIERRDLSGDDGRASWIGSCADKFVLRQDTLEAIREIFEADLHTIRFPNTESSPLSFERFLKKLCNGLACPYDSDYPPAAGVEWNSNSFPAISLHAVWVPRLYDTMRDLLNLNRHKTEGILYQDEVDLIARAPLILNQLDQLTPKERHDVESPFSRIIEELRDGFEQISRLLTSAEIQASSPSAREVMETHVANCESQGSWTQADIRRYGSVLEIALALSEVSLPEVRNHIQRIIELEKKAEIEPLISNQLQSVLLETFAAPSVPPLYQAMRTPGFAAHGKAERRLADLLSQVAIPCGSSYGPMSSHHSYEFLLQPGILVGVNLIADETGKVTINADNGRSLVLSPEDTENFTREQILALMIADNISG